jgi:hypothetical protein
MDADTLPKPPRSVRLNNGIRIALVALWFLAAVLPLLLFVISFYTEAELTRFLKEGVEGVGVVYDKHSRSGKSRSYYLDFRYEVEARLIRVQQASTESVMRAQ